MPHSLPPSHTAVPVYRDRGLGLAGLWLLAILGYNVAQGADGTQITTLSVAAPFLAAALVDRAWRVLLVGVGVLVVYLVSAPLADTVWDKSQWIRIGAAVLATIAATFIAQARLRAQRNTVDVKEVARAVQTAVMRLNTPHSHRATFALRYRAADVQALIGGDALEVVETKWGVRILVADARGKGLGSLRASTLALGAFREWAHEEPDLTDLLTRLHNSLDRELDETEFVTAVVAQLDDLTFTFASAGHPFPTLIRQQVATELELDAITTTPLAMKVPRRPARSASIDLMAGDVVLMVTDGILEARDSDGHFFPFDLEAGQCFSDPDVGASVDRLLDAASAYASGGLSDDIAIAAIRIDDGHRPVAAAQPRPGTDF